jgi:sulfur-carrier protein
VASIRVKFFGPLKEIVGADELRLDVNTGCTGEAAFDQLAQRFPQLNEWKKSVRLAVNLEYTSFAEAVRDGDEICFIPPVSGG